MSLSFTLPGFARATAVGALTVGLLAASPAPGAHASASGSASTSASATAATTTTTPLTRAQRKARAERRARIKVRRKVDRGFAVARRQKGDRYGYGAAGPNRFDCSGLTYYSFRKAGFKHIPRTSSAQAGYVRHIKRKNMRRGDLIFFTDGGGVYHVGIFAGWRHNKRLVLHAPYSGTRVRTDTVWTGSWFPGTLRKR